jgi:hypothetical protein
VGFEPTVFGKYNSFQDYRLKPLDHSSRKQIKGFEPLTLILARLHSTN